MDFQDPLHSRQLAMKFSLVGPVYPYRGGIAHYTASLASALKQHNHTVQTISFKKQYPSWLYPGASDKDPSQKTLSTPAEFILDPFLPWTWEKAFRAIHTKHPNLVITQWWTTFWALPFAYLNARLWKSGIKTAYLIHNVIPHEERKWDKGLAKLALRQGAEFIVQTQSEVERLSKLINNKNIHLCELPPYFGLKTELIAQEDARKELDLPQGHKIFLFFGIVRPYKGLQVLIDAFNELQKTNTNSHLLIAGEFWENKSAYLNQIRQYGLMDQVTLIDEYIPNEKLPVIFAAADCLVAPYTGGTQSAVVGLGIAYGLPTIVTEHLAAGISEENRKYVAVIPAQDCEELTSKMIEMVNQGRPAPVQPDDPINGWDTLVKTIEQMAE